MDMNRGIAVLIAPLLLLGVMGVGPSLGPVLASADAYCRPVPLPHPMGWVTTGAWDGSGTRLFVVDALQRKIFGLSPSGKPLYGFLNGLEKDLPAFLPSRIQSREGRFALELLGDRFITLDKDFVPMTRRALNKEATRGPLSVEKIYIWDLARNGDIIAYADVMEKTRRSEEWTSGFLRIAASNPKDFKFLSPPTSYLVPERTFYKLGMPFITSVGETIYVLRMENNITLYRGRKGDTELQPLSVAIPDAGLSPILPSFSRADQMPAVMHAVEQSTMPVGIYGWNDHLYVVSRRFQQDRSTAWSVSKIDPNSERVVASTLLPVQAQHLTVIPGDRYWAILEKGSVTAFGEQEIKQITFIDSSRMKRLGANLCG
jgi:hypothetical protein